MLDPKDGGWASKKMWMTVLSMNLIVLVGVASAHWRALEANLATLIGGLTATLGLYFGSNVAHSAIIGKNCESLARAQNSLNAAAADDPDDPHKVPPEPPSGPNAGK